MAYRIIVGERLMMTIVKEVSSATLRDASCPYREAQI